MDELGLVIIEETRLLKKHPILICPVDAKCLKASRVIKTGFFERIQATAKINTPNFFFLNFARVHKGKSDNNENDNSV